MNYQVRFEIDIDDAETPLGAASRAWAHIVRSGSTANVFDVTDEQGQTVRVDLQDLSVTPLPPRAPNRVVVVLEGGLVQAVVADRPDELVAAAVDYDTGEYEAEDCFSLCQGDGRHALAVAGHVTVSDPAINIDAVFDHI